MYHIDGAVIPRLISVPTKRAIFFYYLFEFSRHLDQFSLLLAVSVLILRE
jgi:hypothetical protein